MSKLTELVDKIGPGRLMAMAAVAIVLLGFFTVVMVRTMGTSMSPLFAELAVEDAADVTAELEAQGIEYRLERGGSVVMVPQDMVSKLRMELAGQGLPRAGIGYEIFDEGSTLGTTSFVQNINRLRAVEGELSRTISSLDQVSNARVHLVMPERELFSRESQEPSASIVLKVRGALGAGQIRAIQHLTAAAVKDLKPQAVSIVDDAGNLLASGMNDEGFMAATIEERRVEQERRMRADLEAILGRVVGRDAARVQVAIELDASRVSQTSNQYDPESRVVRSTQTRDETRSSQEPRRDTRVSVGAELPGADQGEADQMRRENEEMAEEVVNYEISNTTRTEVMEAGQLRRLSVAVLVDGTHGAAADGTRAYTPRSDEELAQIAALVRSSVGFDEARGDQVEVVNMRFAPPPTPEELGELSWYMALANKIDVMRTIELAVLALLGLLVLVVVVRPMMKRMLEGDPEPVIQKIPLMPEETDEPALLGHSAASDALTAAMAENASYAESVEQIAGLVHNKPDEAVAIVRHWMQEQA